METSFGELDIFIKHKVEYLKFKKSGRGHTHKNYESFMVLKGKGKIQIDDKVFELTEGNIITIPPNSNHFMWPETELEGLVIYHDNDLKFIARKL